MVKSGFWGHISHLLGVCFYREVVLDFHFGHWKCPNREWGKGHISKWKWVFSPLGHSVQVHPIVIKICLSLMSNNNFIFKWYFSLIIYFFLSPLSAVRPWTQHSNCLQERKEWKSSWQWRSPVQIRLGFHMHATIILGEGLENLAELLSRQSWLRKGIQY